MNPDAGVAYKTRVAVVDLSLNNLKSMCRGLSDAGADSVTIVSEPSACESATHVVLPGVGTFSAASAKLQGAGWMDYFNALPDSEGPALLGVCLGLQLMGLASEEGPASAGLGRIPGMTRRLEPAVGERVPHVGWNEVHFSDPHPMLAGIAPGSDFYFTHSYALTPDDSTDVVATTPFAGGFVSAVARGNTWAVQFHPEKSSMVGLQLLRNFLAWDGS